MRKQPMKRSNRYSSSDGIEAWKQLENIHGLGYSLSSIFTDWLDFMLNTLLSTTELLFPSDERSF